MTGLIEEVAFAKINLALHVRAREADGYHRIETLFAFAEDGDRLAGEIAPDLTLAVTGRFGASLEGEGNNLVLRAARAARAVFGVSDGAALVLDKRLPVASGVGGGSADAAATLRLLARLWHLPAADPRWMEIARNLGADVPACLLSETSRGEGRGDCLQPVTDDRLRGMPMLLVNPAVPVSTGPVFAAWDGLDRGALGKGLALDAALIGRNDLEPPARILAPVIGDVLEMLASLRGVVLARMSGSGATCFALFESFAARDAAAAVIGPRSPAWWCLKTALR